MALGETPRFGHTLSMIMDALTERLLMSLAASLMAATPLNALAHLIQRLIT